MASKKNNLTGILLLIFLAAGAGAWYFLKQETVQTKTEKIREGMRFATKTADVYKIFIAKRDGSTTTLERRDDHWILNGKHRANPNVMKNMMTTIGGISVKFIPTKASNEHIIKEMAAIGIKVELYGQSDDLLKTFYVGGSTNDETGTYMMMEGSDQPYVTHIPTLEGGLRWRFNPTGDVWRDKTIFSEKPEDIKFIHLEYPDQKDKSFKLKNVGGGRFEVMPYYDFVPNTGKEINATAVSSYLVGFNRVIAEGFENKSPKRDSVLVTQPFSILKLGRTNGEEQSIRFYPINLEERRAGTGEYLPVHRYYADVNKEDFMKVQQRVVGKLFWGYEQFFK